MVGYAGMIHLRVKKDPSKPAQHPNIEPLCAAEAERLLGSRDFSVGTMFEEEHLVTCLACKMLIEKKASA